MDDSEVNVDECPICLQDMIEKQDIVVLGCCKKHLHSSCYIHCRKTKNTCPMCRTVLCTEPVVCLDSSSSSQSQSHYITVSYDRIDDVDVDTLRYSYIQRIFAGLVTGAVVCGFVLINYIRH